MELPLPKDPARRAMVIGIVCSVLLHLLLLGSMFRLGALGAPAYIKRGEPLLVDLAPDKPEERAPLGNPAKPVGPEPAPRKAPEPPRPKIAEAPPPKAPPAPRAAPPAPRAAPPPQPAPEPSRQMARTEPPAPAPRAPEAPAPRPPEPAPQSPEPPRPRPAEAPRPQPSPAAPSGGAPGTSPAAPSPAPAGERAGPQTALAKPPSPSIFRQPGGGGGLRGGGRGGVEGEPIPLDTTEPRYQDYFNKIREKIRANWIYPREAGDRGLQGELLIEFHIAKDGRVEYLELRHSSGEEILDRFAMNAVRLAQPFPPVPDDIAKTVLAINGLFRYQIIGASLLNQYLR
jgi:TonB family protein